jgi:hypothetical protein
MLVLNFDKELEELKQGNGIGFDINKIELINDFIKNVCEIACGDESILCKYEDGDEILWRYFTPKDIYEALDEINTKYDDLYHVTYGRYSSIEDFEKAKNKFWEENGE